MIDSIDHDDKISVHLAAQFIRDSQDMVAGFCPRNQTIVHRHSVMSQPATEAAPQLRQEGIP